VAQFGQQAPFSRLRYRTMKRLLGTSKRPAGFHETATRQEYGGTRWSMLAWLVQWCINLSNE
jgi:hypothetical protein